jgi:hypothetical protein
MTLASTPKRSAGMSQHRLSSVSLLEQWLIGAVALALALVAMLSLPEARGVE